MLTFIDTSDILLLFLRLEEEFIDLLCQRATNYLLLIVEKRKKCR